jgi:hypothetical protein
MRMLQHYSGIATNGYGCNRVAANSLLTMRSVPVQNFLPRANRLRGERFFGSAYLSRNSSRAALNPDGSCRKAK